jgi:gentisate 1,2-dioxygenase
MTAHDQVDNADTLLEKLEKCDVSPLWSQMARLNPPMPAPRTKPFVWRYEKLRPHLLQAGQLITEKQAERRVLMLVNPARSKQSLIQLHSALIDLSDA